MTDPTSYPQTESAPQIGPKERRRALCADSVARAEAREARQYAEAWLQALRDWQTRTHAELVPRTSSSGGAGNMVAIVGNYARGQGRLRYTQILTPYGWVSEAAVAGLCNSEPLLERVRAGSGPTTLAHSNGRGWASQQAREYGAVLLGMAAVLGDERAERLQHLVLVL